MDAVDQVTQQPFSTKPLASAEYYKAIHYAAKKRSSASVCEYEKLTGFKLSKKWLNNLALHTQVVKKQSEINYQHGYLVYSSFRQRIENASPSENIIA